MHVLPDCMRGLLCICQGCRTDEEAWALLEVLCKAVFVDDCRGCFGDLTVERVKFIYLYTYF